MPPPSEPLREKVLVAVADRLSAIVEGATYWATPALVTRALLPIGTYKSELEVGPVFGIVRSSGSEMVLSAHTATYEARYRFTVEAYVQLRDDVLAGTWLERAWDDQATALMADLTLGGLVGTLEMEGTETDNGGAEPKAWFSQTWVAVFYQDF